MARKQKALKSTIKFLSICRHPAITSQIIKYSPDSVIKLICNAALNAAQGDVSLTRKQKRLLSKYRAFLATLIRKGEPVQKKRKLLLQKGGGIIGLVIPAILSAVLTIVGSKLFQCRENSKQ